MKKKLGFLGAALCLSAVISSSAFAYGDTYNVIQGDSLWKISNKYKVHLGDVVETNTQFDDPNLIYPNDTVYIPAGDIGKVGASMTDNGDGSVRTSAKVNKNIGITSKSTKNEFETKVAQLVNKERSTRGLPLLKLSEEVSNVARVKSEDMRDSKYFDHNSPKYGSPFQMMKEFGIQYRTAGENIAKGQKTPESVMNAWMNSEGHRKNILSPNFREIGVGFVKDNYGTTYWTQQFVTR